MPGHTKRQKQLGAAREAKCQKKESGISQISQSAAWNDDDVDRPDLNCDENSNNEVGISELVEEYTRNWVSDLNRDDLLSLSIVSMIQLKMTDQGKYQRTGVQWHNEELTKLAVWENKVVYIFNHLQIGKTQIMVLSWNFHVKWVLKPLENGCASWALA